MSEREEWLDEVVTTLERRIAASGARPDFLDVVARAHALDPEAVPLDEHAAAEELGLELEVAGDSGLARRAGLGTPGASDAGTAAEDAALDEWLGDVRAAIEGHVEARRQGPRPALVVRRERRAVWWVAGAVLAAGIALVIGAMELVGTMSMESGVRPEQALHQDEQPAPSGEASTRAVEPTSRARPRAVVEREDAAAPTSDPVEPEPVEPEPSEPPASGARSERSSSLAEELATLAGEAQAHWRAGRRDEAQRLFARIVARGGRSRAAEMAFADLFTLAHQQGDAEAQRRWWRAYLRRFPKGRFADDARAGLCRGEPRAEQGACWAEYLEDFPHGSFREEARAAGGDAQR